jgi:hypothetical protein
MLHHLEELAERLGITVRYEAAAGRVGVCRLRGARVAVVDANLRIPDRAAALASVLADEELDGVYIPPEVRRRLAQSSPLRVRPGDEDALDAEPEESAATQPPESGGEQGGSQQSSAGPEADAD